MNKYRKKLPPSVLQNETIDVYDVLTIFGVTCPAVADAVTTLLMPGLRRLKDRRAELCQVMATVYRGLELIDDANAEAK